MILSPSPQSAPLKGEEVSGDLSRKARPPLSGGIACRTPRIYRFYKIAAIVALRIRE